jgi:hypothetical protein
VNDLEKLYAEIKAQPHILGHILGYKDLTYLHSEWVKYLFHESGNRALQAHRESYKTTSLIVGIVLQFLINPDITILLLRKTDTLATEILVTVQRILESPKCVQLFKMYYDFESLKGDNWTKNKLDLSIRKSINPEANLTAMGIGGSVTGKHPDWIIVDDIITREDRHSKAERENVKTYVMELINVVKDSGKIIFTGTPWHPDDAWVTISKLVPEIKKYSVWVTDILSEVKINMAKEGMSGSLFAANYELTHINSDMRFLPDPQYVQWDESVHNFAFLDPAYGGSNYTALSIGGRVGDYIQVKGFVWKKSVSTLYQEILKIIDAHNVGTLIVESNADKGYSARDLYALRGNKGVKPFNETINKHIRIENTVLKHWKIIRFAHDVDREYLNQVLDYVEGEEPDDAPDSLSGLLRIFGIVKKKSLTIS